LKITPENLRAKWISKNLNTIIKTKTY
jgi:hypothetical protein